MVLQRYWTKSKFQEHSTLMIHVLRLDSKFSRFLLGSILGFFIPLTGFPATNSNDGTEFTYRILNQFPHDPEAFTQGLVFHDASFYEGTGLNGKSMLKRLDPDSGKTLLRLSLPDQHFGEGITIVSNE